MLHLRVVPGFWVAVEEVRRPEIRSQPVIMGGLPHQRGVVREASFVAQQRGIQVGMSLAQAFQQCPDGIFLMPDLPAYESTWEVVCDVLRTYTPLVEPLEMGQAVADLSGCERLWGDGLEAARTISAHVRRLTGIYPWLGVATNRLVAQLASTTVGVEGIAVIDRGQEAAFLANLPLTLLPGLEPRLALTFQVLGLRTIGQLAALPAASVRQRFGAVGERLHAYARGIDTRPVVPPREKPSVSARRECEDGSIDETLQAIRLLSETCASELQQRRLAGTVVELTLLPPPQSPEGQSSSRISDEDTPIPETAVEEHAGLADRAEALPSGSNRSNSFPPDESNPSDPSLPIAYRIHSMLPQPRPIPSTTGASPPAPVAHGSASPDQPAVHNTAPSSQPVVRSTALPGELAVHGITPSAAADPAIHVKTVVRTPVDTASRLLETAQRLLLQHWPKGHEFRSHAVELRVSEFPAPKQLSFPELNRIGQVGSLGGATAERLQSLAEGEQVLLARYGDASFRHLTRLDPANVLTERRFSWGSGLPWDVS